MKLKHLKFHPNRTPLTQRKPIQSANLGGPTKGLIRWPEVRQPSQRRMCSHHQSASSRSASNQHFSRSLDHYTSVYPQAMANYLRRGNPVFAVESRNVELLTKPASFYNRILHGIQTAKKRVSLSCLYLGTEPQCEKIIEELKKSCTAKPHLRVHFNLDFLRGTRVSRNTKFQSSVHLINTLLAQFPDRVSCTLYRTPNLRSLATFLPERINEILGVYHMKSMIFDNDIMLTGANLNESYFTQRQDRYMYLHTQPDLVQYLEDISDTIGSFSHWLNPDGSLRTNYDPGFDADSLIRFSQNQMEQFFQSHRGTPGIDCDTLILPTMQNGTLDVRQDEETLVELIQYIHATPKSNLYLSSPYFNLSPRILDLILSPHARDICTHIITASPQANGFYTAKDISRLIPRSYAVLEKDFFDQVQARNLQEFVHLSEFSRPDWTFHAKGLWADLEPGEFATIFGSANFSVRSQNRDVEFQLLVMTRDARLISDFQNERDLIWKDALKVDADTFKSQDHRASFPFRLLSSKFSSSFM